MSTILETRGLTKVYNAHFLHRHGITAVDHVHLSVERGEILAILGTNGAGKSTFVKLLLNLVRPTSGRVSSFGIDVSSSGWPHSVGYLPEAFQIREHIPVRKFLALAGRLSGIQGRALDICIDDVLHRLGLEDVSNRSARTLSKGMSTRLGIAQAILHKPHLLFLDEPTDGLDPLGRIAVRQLLTELRREGTTILLNSHLLSEVESLADRIAIFRRGSIVTTGSIPDLLPRDVSYSVEVPTDPLLAPGWLFRKHEEGWCSTVTGDHQLRLLLKALDLRGIIATNIVPVRTSLEEMFKSHYS